MSERIDAAELSDVIGAIYDCAVDPGLWPAAIEQIVGLVQGANGVVMVIDTVENKNRFVASWNVDFEVMRTYNERYHADNPLIASTRVFGVDEPWNVSTALDQRSWLESRVYQEFGRVQGWLDNMGVAIMKTPTRFASLAVPRKEEYGFAGSRELEVLRLLSPHVRRAISITDLLDMRCLTAAAAEEALHGLATAVILVDGASRITFANGAAQAVLSAGDPVRVDHDVLQARDPAAATSLSAALAKAREPESDMGKVGIDVSVPLADGRPAFAHVLPIGSSKVRAALSQNAIAAIFLTPAGSPVKLPLATLSATFGFTPTEAKIIERLVAGDTISDAGAALGIAPTTARTHLARIMDKAGTERQADLIRLVTGLAAPVRRDRQ
jgi:DNA-binding CsgD family transcriptional regulator